MGENGGFYNVGTTSV